MKIKIIVIAVIAFLLTAIVSLFLRLKKVEKDRDIQTQNVASLMLSVSKYKTKDSLQVASVSQLQLSLEQFRSYRAEDAKLIESLQVDNKRLQGVISAQTESYYEHTILLRDSIKVLMTQSDTIIKADIKAGRYADKWHEIDFSVQNDSLTYKLKTHEDIIITNHIIPKRFLFFKFGVKDVKTDVVSKNPYTSDISVQSILIK